MAVYTEYTWVFVCSIFVAFFAAFGIGANDLANSFGTSVGTKAITMWQAVLIAAVCEWTGAFFLGAGVTDTIKSGIAKTSSFTNMPDVFLYGMFCVMIAAAFWDNFACHLELPVSTTHTTVGAIIGFALVAGGGDAVVWYASKDSFPYFSGFAAVAASWVVSPIAAGIAVAVVYWLLRFFVLRSKHSFKLTLILLPLMVGATFGLITGFITQTGAKNGAWDPVSDGEVAWISVTVAVGTALICLFIVMPMLRRKAIKDEQNLANRMADVMAQQAAVQAGVDNGDVKAQKDVESGSPAVETPDGADSAQDTAQVSAQDTISNLVTVDPALAAKVMYDLDSANKPSESKYTLWIADKYHKSLETKAGRAIFQNKVAKALGHSLFYNVHDAVKEDATVAAVWENAEVFDFKTERLFRYLQVFSAMAMSFAHGSNDVANAMGPFSAVYYTWENSKVPGKKTHVPEWVLAVGGAGIVCGLATFGYKIMRVLGVKSVKLTNCRGFVCEWCTALVVVIASRYGLPVSTTQVICGAILAIGLFEGVKKGVNWWVALKIACGWVLTIIVAGCVAAFFTAVAIYSPNKNSTNDIFNAAQIVNKETFAQLTQLNATAMSTNDATLQSSVNSNNGTLTTLWQTYVPDIVAISNLQTSTFGLFNTTECPNMQ